ncbi:hypothetical protein DAI22_12g082300 [Oryza sativa Japonica Group]|nr:hypothetical protein DAI22_12g082300 [Oryza sativa Japonica Group]
MTIFGLKQQSLVLKENCCLPIVSSYYRCIQMIMEQPFDRPIHPPHRTKRMGERDTEIQI